MNYYYKYAKVSFQIQNAVVICTHYWKNLIRSESEARIESFESEGYWAPPVLVSSLEQQNPKASPLFAIDKVDGFRGRLCENGV